MILTLDEAKTLIGNAANGKDDLINLLIPIVDDFIKQKTNNPFLDALGQDLYPAGVKLPASQIIKYLINQGDNSLTSEALGSYTIAYLNDLPPVVISMLKPFTKVIIA